MNGESIIVHNNVIEIFSEQLEEIAFYAKSKREGTLHNSIDLKSIDKQSELQHYLFAPCSIRRSQSEPYLLERDGVKGLVKYKH